MNKQQEKQYLQYVEKLKNIKKSENSLNALLDRDTICKINIKVLSALMDSFYLKGDEISVHKIIKSKIDCIPLDIFRYLLLFVADKETKMKIYFHVLKENRLDLIPSIKGLTSKDYDLIYKSYKDSTDEDKKLLLAKQLSKAIKKENEKKTSKISFKYDTIRRYKSSKK
jgi:hypothetical protein